MFSITENERMTRVGPGTPMGVLLTRYWHPIAASAELARTPQGGEVPGRGPGALP